MKTFYGLYGRNTTKHKWRLQSVVFDEELANLQAFALVEQAKHNGYDMFEIKIKTSPDMSLIPQTWEGR